MTKSFDVLIVGGGAAGLMCAIQAGKRGRKVALLDHGPRLGAKILISGGGRCNFTNLGAGPENYVSKNPHFCKSALSRYPASAFIQWVEQHKIAFHEKKLGQLFCDDSAKDIVGMLLDESSKAGVEIFLDCAVSKVDQEEGFRLTSSQGGFRGKSLVVATGGLSVPKIGASDWGYRLAKQFGLGIIGTAPALDGFLLKPPDQRKFDGLMGVSAEVEMSCGGMTFRENILFTHGGLSGPAALQASLYWSPGEELTVNFLPEFAGDGLRAWFIERKKTQPKAELKNPLREKLPKRLADRLCESDLAPRVPLWRLSDKTLAEFCDRLRNWTLIPESTVGYAKAEVTRGGVDTAELSSQTMECKKVPGLYFIGEVVDVTGWLGGYNFQWAWASGFAAGQAV